MHPIRLPIAFVHSGSEAGAHALLVFDQQAPSSRNATVREICGDYPASRTRSARPQKVHGISKHFKIRHRLCSATHKINVLSREHQSETDIQGEKSYNARKFCAV